MWVSSCFISWIKPTRMIYTDNFSSLCFVIKQLRRGFITCRHHFFFLLWDCISFTRRRVHHISKTRCCSSGVSRFQGYKLSVNSCESWCILSAKSFCVVCRSVKVNAPCWCSHFVTEGAPVWIKNSLIDKEAEGESAPANCLSNALINQSSGEATTAGPVKCSAAAVPPAARLSAWRRRITGRRPSTCLRVETAADCPLFQHAGPRDQFSSHLMIQGVKWRGGGGGRRGGGGQHMITKINRFN